MAKSASVYARIDPVLKEQAETILSTLGIPTSNAIDMFFKQIVLKKGLPFEVRLPYEKPVCMGALSKEELNAKIEKEDEIIEKSFSITAKHIKYKKQE